MSKYGNKKTVVYGIKFDSKAEANRFLKLKAMEQKGEISELQLQVPFELAPSVVINGRKRPAMKYIADFVYKINGNQVIEDTKGMLTQLYIAKRHLMMSVHGLSISEIR